VCSIVPTGHLGSCLVALVTKIGFQNRSLSLCRTIMQSITSPRSLKIQSESVYVLYKRHQFNISSSSFRIFVPYRWLYIMMPRGRTLASFITSVIHQQNAHIQCINYNIFSYMFLRLFRHLQRELFLYASNYCYICD
jgi:hypothetical protein